MSLLKVDNLTLQFDTDEGRILAVEDVSFEVNPARYWAWWGNPAPASR